MTCHDAAELVYKVRCLRLHRLFGHGMTHDAVHWTGQKQSQNAALKFVSLFVAAVQFNRSCTEPQILRNS